MDNPNSAFDIRHATLASLSDEDLKSQLENRPCKRRRCRAVPLDDSEFCARHERDQRRYNRDYDRRRRAEWEAQKRCTRCGAKERKPGSKWCSACVIMLGRVRKSDLKSQLENLSTSKAARIAARIIPWKDSPLNAGRKRLRGGSRGRRAKSVEDRSDIADLRRYAEEADKGFVEASSPAVQALGRIQREGAHHAMLSWVSLLVRTGAEMLRRNKYPLPDLKSPEPDDPADDE